MLRLNEDLDEDARNRLIDSLWGGILPNDDSGYDSEDDQEKLDDTNDSDSNSNSDSSNEGNRLDIIEEEEAEVAAPNEDAEEDGINQDQNNEDVLEESDDDSDFDEGVLGSDTESVSKEETVHTRKLQTQSKRPTRSGYRKLKYNYNEESSDDDEEEEAIDTTKQSASSTRSGRNDDGGNVSKDGSDSDDSSINEAVDTAIATQSARSTDDSDSDDYLIDPDKALEKQRNDLRKKKMRTVRQENHEKELKAVHKDLAEGLKRIQNNWNPPPTLKQLTALIMSKGKTPPPKATDGKQTQRNLLESVWKEVEGKCDWQRTTYFTESDKNELDAIEKQLYSM